MMTWLRVWYHIYNISLDIDFVTKICNNLCQSRMELQLSTLFQSCQLRGIYIDAKINYYIFCIQQIHKIKATTNTIHLSTPEVPDIFPT